MQSVSISECSFCTCFGNSNRMQQTDCKRYFGIDETICWIHNIREHKFRERTVTLLDATHVHKIQPRNSHNARTAENNLRQFRNCKLIQSRGVRGEMYFHVIFLFISSLAVTHQCWINFANDKRITLSTDQRFGCFDYAKPSELITRNPNLGDTKKTCWHRDARSEVQFAFNDNNLMISIYWWKKRILTPP